MNWIDKAIGFVSPQWGAKREAWRNVLNDTRSQSYDAGNYDRLNSGWRALNESAEYTDRYNRDTVRARARDLERNSDMMNALLGAFKRNVFGGGYILQSDTKDEKTNKLIEDNWKKWCKKQNCDVTGTQSFNQIMRMCVERKKVDGGILLVKRYTNQGFLPFQIQTFEVDELDDRNMATNKPGNKVIGGIEYNAYNRPIGYWIKQYSIDGIESDPKFIEAKDVIFYYSKRRPSQVREMSDMSHTITRIRDANEFMTAVSVKQRIEACLSVFIKKSLPTTGLGRNGVGATQQQDYNGKTIAPGMIKELNAGDEIQVVNPSGQSTDASSFIKLMQRLVGAGQGISYESMSRDMSSSTYSSARQGSIEDEMTYEEEVELLKEMMSEIYETFVISLYLVGILEKKDFWNKKEIYLKHKWVKSPKKWIDPYKEAMANKVALNTGQKTFKQIAAEQGRDYKEQIDDTRDVLSYAREKGIEIGGVIFGTSEQSSIYAEENGNEDE